MRQQDMRSVIKAQDMRAVIKDMRALLTQDMRAVIKAEDAWRGPELGLVWRRYEGSSSCTN